MRKETFIGHICWAAVALCTFALGWIVQTSSPTGARAELPSTTLMESGAVSATSILGPSSQAGGQNSEQNVSMGEGRFRSGDDWKESVEQAVRYPNPVKRLLAFNRLLEALTPQNALEIREQLASLRPDRDQWRDFHYAWGALAGEEAFLFAAESEERDLDATLTGWASANPTEALAMLDNLPESLRGQREGLARSVVEGLSDRDRTQATELVLRLANEGLERSDQLMEIVAREALRTEGPESAARWSESLPDGPLKGAAMDRIAGEYAERDVEAAAKWAEAHADREYAACAVAEVGERWAARDPVAAVGWLETLPEGQGQKAGLNNAFGDWEDRDPYAATEYLSSMPQSTQRDAAISGFSRGYVWQDPEVAIAWALDISDPGIRQETVTRAGQVFFRRDPAAASAWLQQSGLPPEAQEAILDTREG